MDVVPNRLPVVERDFPTSAHLLAEFMCSEQSETLYSPSQLLFRGESSEHFALIPSALRPGNKERFIQLVRGAGLSFPDSNAINSEHMHIDAEYALTKAFYRTANKNGLKLPPIPYKWHDRLQRDQPWVPDSEKEWIPDELAELIALMQHYGVPTRLLDWSTNILIALFFAADGAEKRLRAGLADESDHMVIWILRRPIDLLDESTGNLAFPIRFVTPSYANNPNICAQKGVLSYTLVSPHSTAEVSITPLDQYLQEYYNTQLQGCLETVLTKVRIPIKNCKHTLKILSSFGIDSSSIFPGYASILNRIDEAGYNKY